MNSVRQKSQRKFSTNRVQKYVWVKKISCSLIGEGEGFGPLGWLFKEGLWMQTVTTCCFCLFYNSLFTTLFGDLYYIDFIMSIISVFNRNIVCYLIIDYAMCLNIILHCQNRQLSTIKGMMDESYHLTENDWFEG